MDVRPRWLSPGVYVRKRQVIILWEVSNMLHNGVMTPESVHHNEPVTIEYDGLLSRAGADRIYLHFGTDGWNNVETIPMSRRSVSGFMATVVADGNKEVNFCFKDSANNWDNNNGWNWECKIQ